MGSFPSVDRYFRHLETHIYHQTVKSWNQGAAGIPLSYLLLFLLKSTSRMFGTCRSESKLTEAKIPTISALQKVSINLKNKCKFFSCLFLFLLLQSIYRKKPQPFPGKALNFPELFILPASAILPACTSDTLPASLPPAQTVYFSSSISIEKNQLGQEFEVS